MYHNSVLTNCVLFKDTVGELRLLGEVVQDVRFPVGHHIKTSKVLSCDTIDGNTYVKTESGTIYKINLLYDLIEYKKYINSTYKSPNREYYLSFLDLKD